MAAEAALQAEIYYIVGDRIHKDLLALGVR